MTFIGFVDISLGIQSEIHIIEMSVKTNSNKSNRKQIIYLRGFQMSHPICLDKEAKEQVDEILCDPGLRPRPHINECNPQKCPPLYAFN